jgi:hypothetical protein
MGGVLCGRNTSTIRIQYTIRPTPENCAIPVRKSL